MKTKHIGLVMDDEIAQKLENLKWYLKISKVQVVRLAIARLYEQIAEKDKS